MNEQRSDSLEEISETVLRVTAECHRDIAMSTVAFLAWRPFKTIANGSGVLLQVGEKRFIATAAHVVESSVFGRLEYSIAPIRSDERAIPLRGAPAIRTEADQIDVAVIELADHIAQELEAGRRFVRLSEVEFNPIASEGIYLLMGYPSQLSSIDAVAQSISIAAHPFVTTIWSGHPPASVDFDRTKHILLDYSEQSYDSAGRPSSAIELRGISGGGIWRLSTGKELKRWTPSSRKLVAIEHSWSEPHGYVKGTWAFYAVKLVWDHYPELHDEIRRYCMT